MSIITAYKSDTDNKLFEKKEDYIKHLKRIAKQKLFSNKTNYLEKKNIEFNQKLKEIKNVNELINFIMNNQSLLIKNGIYQNFKSYKLAVRLDSLIYPKNYKISNVKITSVTWSDEVSTSHCRPTDKTATAYSILDSQPGWLANIAITFDNSEKTKGVHICSEMFRQTPLNTGTGGSNDGIHYDYSLKLFAVDFPAMIIPFLKHELKNNVDLGYFEVNERINVIKKTLPQKYNLNNPEILELTDLLMINHKKNAAAILEELFQSNLKEKDIIETKKLKV